METSVPNVSKSDIDADVSFFHEQKQYVINESAWSIFALTRFFLSTIVLVGHLAVFAPMPIALYYVKILGARAAVLGFLLISGISIGYSYNKSKNGYFSRRFLRIYPLYFVAVLLTVYLQWLLGSPYQLFNQTMAKAGVLTSIANFFFLQNFASITITYNGPLWSLSAEVFFYLLVPIIFRIPLRVLQIALVFLILIFAFSNANLPLYGVPALVYAWPWLLGFLVVRGQSVSYTSVFLSMGFVAALFSKQITEQHESLSWVTFLLASVVVLLCSSMYFKLSKHFQVIFNYLGDLSYPLYLFHFPLYLLLYYLGLRNAWYFLVLICIMVIPLNYVFDVWLKRIFWKPVVKFVNNKFAFL